VAKPVAHLGEKDYGLQTLLKRDQSPRSNPSSKKYIKRKIGREWAPSEKTQERNSAQEEVTFISGKEAEKKITGDKGLKRSRRGISFRKETKTCKLWVTLVITGLEGKRRGERTIVPRVKGGGTIGEHLRLMKRI